ncbi:AI-2E family transporter [Aquibium sp. A9E412]|uniref:AI-2E family transporter n=1 Tax=Aquibium sp. A9E412 TaxID=2976767 RepID=UPI0025AF130D|nr:AI-2E family transporter [Aquibium sp. A9E412]MDN2568451.1 AI-2E family transporter [Aquibium sp. A9E412]
MPDRSDSRFPAGLPRRRVTAIVLALVALLLVVLVPGAVLVTFAGLLVAVLLHGGGVFLAHRLHLPEIAGIAIFLVIAALLVAGFVTLAAGTVAAQLDQLANQLPEAMKALRQQLGQSGFGRALLQRFDPSKMVMSEARTAVFTTFGAAGNLVVIVFIGAYVALNPTPYRKGLLALAAPSLHPRLGYALDAAAATLKRWLGAQLIAMTVVGTLTGAGLWLIGLPLAPILGLIAGLLAFVPIIGPLLALVPAVLLAFGEGSSMVLWVLAVYLGVQTLESYLITPLLQQESVSLPPALIIANQLVFGILFGLLGVALATPAAALGLTLTRILYVEPYVAHEDEEHSGRPPGGG